MHLKSVVKLNKNQSLYLLSVPQNEKPSLSPDSTTFVVGVGNCSHFMAGLCLPAREDPGDVIRNWELIKYTLKLL